MIKLFRRLSKKDLLLMLLSIAFIVAQVYLDLKLPDYMSSITKLLQTNGTKIKDLYNPGGLMMLCAFGSLISSVIVGFFAASIAASFSKKLRKDVFNKVTNFGMKEVREFSTSSLITRTTNDITQIQTLIAMGLQLMIKAPITAIWAVLKIYSKNFEWTLCTGVAVLVLLITIGIIMLGALPKYKVVQKMTDKLNGITRENLKGIRVIRAYNAEGYQQGKFDKANNDLTHVNTFTQKLMGIMSPSMSLIMNSLALSIYFIGAYLINTAGMMDKINLFSDMIVFSSYAMQVVISFMMLAIVFLIFPRASISAKRISEVLDTEESIKDGTINKCSNDYGIVEFKNVSFKYPDAEEYMLEGINLKVEKGQTVAFIGSTGCGKSTLINLIPRFYDATEGEVLVDGINVKDYELKTLYNKLGYIPQKAVMFGGSVNYNVTYGESLNKKPTEKDIKEAVKIAQAKEFVESMSEGYSSHVAQGGSNISGGQKQRLAIARAIVRKPEIYIFDDSFSALDYKTDSVLRKCLKEYVGDSTVLIVAQRIGTIKEADKIVVLDSGKCVGIGKHKELLKTCKIYKEIALSQLSEEELNEK